MDAVEFLKKKNQICKEYSNRPGACFVCPLGNDEGGCQISVITEEDLVQIVEKYTAEHPTKTRQSEFLKMFPDARLDLNGILCIDPCDINKRVKEMNELSNKCQDCGECRKKYWLTEVE